MYKKLGYLLLLIVFCSSVCAQESRTIIRGVVEDDLGNLISGAELKFQCEGDFTSFPQKTDKFGSFFVQNIPEGKCRVFALHRGKVGYADLELSNNELYDVQVTIDRKEAFKDYLYLVIVAIVVYLSYIFWKLRKKKQNDTTKRIGDILETLPQKEKMIVEHMLKHDNEVSNSVIKHTFMIPRTSLSRIVASLEKKKIVTVEKHGKAIKLKLSEWFLTKKEMEQK